MIRKVWFCCWLVLLVVVALTADLLLPGAGAQAAETNLALGKTVTVNQGGTLNGTAASHMTDGSLSTMWRSYDASTPSTLTAGVTLDLGSKQAFNKIVITEYKQKSVRLTVDVSENNTQWTQVYTKSFTAAGTSNRVTEIWLDSQFARYIRVTAPDAVYAFGIYELQVYDTNLARGKAVTINQGGTLTGTAASKITDGDPSTMWRSYDASTPTNLTAGVTLDLGAQQLFNQIVMTEYKQKSTQLTVEISDDNILWYTVFSRSFTASGTANRITKVDADNLSARYIRVTANQATYAFGIYELQVYNVPDAPPGPDGSMVVNKGLYGGAPQAVGVTKANFQLYLFIGQSNMASRAPVQSQDMDPISRAYLFNGLNQWEIAEPGLVTNRASITATQGFNRYSSVEVASKVNGLNAASVFAKALTEANPNIAVGVISNARGGTSIAEWQKGAGTGLYEEAVRRTKEAMKTGTLKGIIWHQGESDQSKVGTYMSSLQTLVANLRTDLGDATNSVPFIAGQLLPTKSADFNALITTIPQHIPNSGWVSSAGTASIGDGTHFDAASQRLLGQRYAEQVSGP